ncbi:serine hydrolase domain-containing protein [Paenibacillus senegalimassiliensis]|uniref:serine hydrolase domain-containing protein n=1 Tax=Paenibacillus senegalimassiliensis TaxID=1737426 RepID=UPI00073EB4AC|nr:serine hydrolase domain-containing protein [Paenibacillus senegalimassiliensis]
MGSLTKKLIITTIASLILVVGLATRGYALPAAQSEAIQTLLDDARRVSGVPGISVSIIDGDETFYFSSGFADRENGLPASENTIYELASVSKAFTSTGILLLEEQGLLSMTDPIQNYLPWLTLKYQGIPVDMQTVTLNDFLHHTSGLTNGKHIQGIPQGDTPDMLRKTVDLLVDAELAFLPGEQYSYGTVNYDVLGLVIEVVSGQSYENFMTQQVFQPLGLHNTYVYKADAQATGQMAQGYRTSFFITTPYDAPDYAGNKPAGYIMSSAMDMTRWMNIQMGFIQDIPEVFNTIILKSHQGDTSVPDINGMYYAAGWSVNTDRTIVEHTGGNPNFATQVTMLPDERFAVCLLSNSANTNIELVKSIKNILDGDLAQSYKMSARQILDIVLSSVTMIACLSAVALFLLGLRRKKRNTRQQTTKKRQLTSMVWLTVTVAMCIMCWMFPVFSGYDWSTILVWQTYSILTTFISLTLLSMATTWLVYVR